MGAPSRAGSSTKGAPSRAGSSARHPPPGLQKEFLKRDKQGAQGQETKDEDKRQKVRLKDPAKAEPNPTTSYDPEVMQYSKVSPEGSVQQTHTSFCDQEHDYSAPRLRDTSDSQGEMGQSYGAFKALWLWVKKKMTNVTS
jgi:hypothetical protein